MRLLWRVVWGAGVRAGVVAAVADVGWWGAVELDGRGLEGG